MRKTYFVAAVSLVSLIVGCQSSGIIQISPDTYKVSQKSAGGIFTDTAKLRDEVIEQANVFAASKGKIAVEVSTHSEHPLVGGLPSFEYVFKLADKSAPNTVAPESHGDLYTEILKLDDLRKKGLITDAEYDAQKQKLLNQTK